MTELIIGCGFAAFGGLCYLTGCVRTRLTCNRELDELIQTAGQITPRPIDHADIRRRIEEATGVDPSQ